MIWPSDFAHYLCGYLAKIACASHFVCQRPWDKVMAEEVAGSLPLFPKLAKFTRFDDRVTVEALGKKRVAIYDPTSGSVLTSRDHLTPPPLRERTKSTPLPHRLELGPFDPRLQRLAESFLGGTANTRSILIYQGNRRIVEAHAPGTDPEKRQCGWSLGKSIVNMSLGALVHQGLIQLSEKDLFAQWRWKADDPRREITLDHLLQMASGLDLGHERYQAYRDIIPMLFGADSVFNYAVSVSPLSAAGQRWVYASAQSALIYRYLRQTLPSRGLDTDNLPQDLLFDPLGMDSALIERDPMGDFVWSSFTYATPADWAKLGLLMLKDGDWFGTRLLPKGWRDFSLQPVDGAGARGYGRHMWLGCHDSPDPYARKVPAGVGHFTGHEGQNISILPMLDMVVVRMGLARPSRTWDQGAFLGRIIEALE